MNPYSYNELKAKLDSGIDVFLDITGGTHRNSVAKLFGLEKMMRGRMASIQAVLYTFDGVKSYRIEPFYADLSKKRTVNQFDNVTQKTPVFDRLGVEIKIGDIITSNTSGGVIRLGKVLNIDGFGTIKCQSLDENNGKKIKVYEIKKIFQDDYMNILKLDKEIMDRLVLRKLSS